MADENMTQEMANAKTLRMAIDANIKLCESLTPQPGSSGGREMALVKTKLQEAKMWAGMYLGALGRLLPAEFRDEVPIVPQSPSSSPDKPE